MSTRPHPNRHGEPTVRILWLTVFVAGVVTANWAASHLGLMPVWFGLLVPAGTLFAGVTFVARDLLHRTAGQHWRRWVFAAIVTGTVASVTLSLRWGSPIPGISAMSIAVASGGAFLLSESADTLVYAPLRDRRWRNHDLTYVAMLLSNTVGAAIDTWLFLWWSDFDLTWPAFWGQIIAKAVWVSIPCVLAIAAVDRWRKRRAVRGDLLRQPVHPESS